MPETALASLHAFDIVLGIIALVFVAIGMHRGLIGEAFRFAAVAAGFVVSVLFYSQVYHKLTFIPFSDSARVVVAFVALFVATAAVVVVVGWMVRKIIRLTILGWVDRLGGGLFGLLKVLILTWIFVRSVEASPFDTYKKKMRRSPVYSVLSSVPPEVTVPYLVKSKQTVDKVLKGKNPLKDIEGAKEKLDEFRTKVDSAKAVYESAAEKVEEVVEDADE